MTPRPIALLLVFLAPFFASTTSARSLGERPERGGAGGSFAWTPYVAGEIYGGQSFFSGDDDSPVNGPNGSILFVPGFRWGDRFTLLPSLSLDYHQTRDVQELIGGGFLTQEQSNQSAAVKALWRLSDRWRLKSHASFKQQLVKETTDESWGDGLFDFQKSAGGIEFERAGAALRSARVGVDYYQVRFPNFDSLSAEAQQFGGEINAGDRVLDHNALDFTVGGDLSAGSKAVVSFNAVASDRRFPDQNLVQLDGTYAPTQRHDLYLYGSAALRRELPSVQLLGRPVEWLTGVDASWAWLNSNQSNYDTNRTVFNHGYYDYNETTLGPRLSLRFNRAWSLGLGVSWAYRRYGRRPVQDADGTYLSGNIKTATWTYRLSLGYPLTARLDAVLSGAYQDARSNMRNESVYRYNFSSANYFGGLAFKL